MSSHELWPSSGPAERRLRIAVIGSGISALSCAWLLASRHEVVLYERAERLGGHSNTVSVVTDAGEQPVDTGFIVFNSRTYPNFTALMDHLGLATRATDMSFSVSRDAGRFEYAAPGLFAQRRNVMSPRFWGMLCEILRFYRQAPSDLMALRDPDLSLGDYLTRRGFSRTFQHDHLLPMAAAIWSSPSGALADYPAQAFIRFCENHGLLQLRDRPEWRTVVGGSRAYVERLALRLGAGVRLGQGAARVVRTGNGVMVVGDDGRSEWFNQVVLGAHADQSLSILADPTPQERRLLGSFRYSRNLAVLHTDQTLMPRRRRAWASWNYIADGEGLCVSYWMNRLQGLSGEDLFVTLNPPRPPASEALLRSESYEHPVFDAAAVRAQEMLWSLQGQGGVWYCGAYFGAGFHEDGLQSGLAVAEQLGSVRRPWRVVDENGRVPVRTPARTLAGAA